MADQGAKVYVKNSPSGESPTLVIERAKSITLLVGEASNFENPEHNTADIQRTVDQTFDAAQHLGLPAVLAQHVSAFEEISSRASVSFGSGPQPAVANLPTNKRIDEAHKNGPDGDPGLFALMFKFGRYLLASSSNPISGSHPANLQGVWNSDMNPPWNRFFSSFRIVQYTTGCLLFVILFFFFLEQRIHDKHQHRDELLAIRSRELG